MWTNGMAAHNGADVTMVEMDSEILPNINLYGVDPEGPVPLEDHGTVQVHDIQNPFSLQIFQELQSAINPMRESQTYGIDIYTDAIDLLGI